MSPNISWPDFADNRRLELLDEIKRLKALQHIEPYLGDRQISNWKIYWNCSILKTRLAYMEAELQEWESLGKGKPQQESRPKIYTIDGEWDQPSMLDTIYQGYRRHCLASGKSPMSFYDWFKATCQTGGGYLRR